MSNSINKNNSERHKSEKDTIYLHIKNKMKFSSIEFCILDCNTPEKLIIEFNNHICLGEYEIARTFYKQILDICPIYLEYFYKAIFCIRGIPDKWLLTNEIRTSANYIWLLYQDYINELKGINNCFKIDFSATFIKSTQFDLLISKGFYTGSELSSNLNININFFKQIRIIYNFILFVNSNNIFILNKLRLLSPNSKQISLFLEMEEVVYNNINKIDFKFIHQKSFFYCLRNFILSQPLISQHILEEIFMFRQILDNKKLKETNLKINTLEESLKIIIDLQVLVFEIYLDLILVFLNNNDYYNVYEYLKIVPTIITQKDFNDEIMINLIFILNVIICLINNNSSDKLDLASFCKYIIQHMNFSDKMSTKQKLFISNLENINKDNNLTPYENKEYIYTYTKKLDNYSKKDNFKIKDFDMYLAKHKIYESLLANKNIVLLQILFKLENIYIQFKLKNNKIPEFFTFYYNNISNLETSLCNKYFNINYDQLVYLNLAMVQKDENYNLKSYDFKKINNKNYNTILENLWKRSNDLMFWDNYINFLRNHNEHCLLYAIKKAINLVSKKEFDMAVLFLHPMNNLKLLLIILQWEKFNGNIHYQKKLLKVFWESYLHNKDTNYYFSNKYSYVDYFENIILELDYLINFSLYIENKLKENNLSIDYIPIKVFSNNAEENNNYKCNSAIKYIDNNIEKNSIDYEITINSKENKNINQKSNNNYIISNNNLKLNEINNENRTANIIYSKLINNSFPKVLYHMLKNFEFHEISQYLIFNFPVKNIQLQKYHFHCMMTVYSFYFYNKILSKIEKFFNPESIYIYDCSNNLMFSKKETEELLEIINNIILFPYRLNIINDVFYLIFTKFKDIPNASILNDELDANNNNIDLVVNKSKNELKGSSNINNTNIDKSKNLNNNNNNDLGFNKTNRQNILNNYLDDNVININNNNSLSCDYKISYVNPYYLYQKKIIKSLISFLYLIIKPILNFDFKKDINNIFTSEFLSINIVDKIDKNMNYAFLLFEDLLDIDADYNINKDRFNFSYKKYLYSKITNLINNFKELVFRFDIVDNHWLEIIYENMENYNFLQAITQKPEHYLQISKRFHMWDTAEHLVNYYNINNSNTNYLQDIKDMKFFIYIKQQIKETKNMVMNSQDLEEYFTKKIVLKNFLFDNLSFKIKSSYSEFDNKNELKLNEKLNFEIFKFFFDICLTDNISPDLSKILLKKSKIFYEKCSSFLDNDIKKSIDDMILWLDTIKETDKDESLSKVVVSIKNLGSVKISEYKAKLNEKLNREASLISLMNKVIDDKADYSSLCLSFDEAVKSLKEIEQEASDFGKFDYLKRFLNYVIKIGNIYYEAKLKYNKSLVYNKNNIAKEEESYSKTTNYVRVMHKYPKEIIAKLFLKYNSEEEALQVANMTKTNLISVILDCTRYFKKNILYGNDFDIQFQYIIEKINFFYNLLSENKKKDIINNGHLVVLNNVKQESNFLLNSNFIKLLENDKKYFNSLETKNINLLEKLKMFEFNNYIEREEYINGSTFSYPINMKLLKFIYNLYSNIKNQNTENSKKYNINYTYYFPLFISFYRFDFDILNDEEQYDFWNILIDKYSNVYTLQNYIKIIFLKFYYYKTFYQNNSKYKALFDKLVMKNLSNSTINEYNDIDNQNINISNSKNQNELLSLSYENIKNKVNNKELFNSMLPKKYLFISNNNINFSSNLSNKIYNYLDNKIKNNKNVVFNNYKENVEFKENNKYDFKLKDIISINYNDKVKYYEELCSNLAKQGQFDLALDLANNYLESSKSSITQFLIDQIIKETKDESKISSLIIKLKNKTKVFEYVKTNIYIWKPQTSIAILHLIKNCEDINKEEINFIIKKLNIFSNILDSNILYKCDNKNEENKDLLAKNIKNTKLNNNIKYKPNFIMQLEQDCKTNIKKVLNKLMNHNEHNLCYDLLELFNLNSKYKNDILFSEIKLLLSVNDMLKIILALEKLNNIFNINESNKKVFFCLKLITELQNYQNKLLIINYILKNHYNQLSDSEILELEKTKISIKLFYLLPKKIQEKLIKLIDYPDLIIETLMINEKFYLIRYINDYFPSLLDKTILSKYCYKSMEFNSLDNKFKTIIDKDTDNFKNIDYKNKQYININNKQFNKEDNSDNNKILNNNSNNSFYFYFKDIEDKVLNTTVKNSVNKQFEPNDSGKAFVKSPFNDDSIDLVLTLDNAEYVRNNFKFETAPDYNLFKNFLDLYGNISDISIICFNICNKCSEYLNVKNTNVPKLLLINFIDKILDYLSNILKSKACLNNNNDSEVNNKIFDKLIIYQKITYLFKKFIIINIDNSIDLSLSRLYKDINYRYTVRDILIENDYLILSEEYCNILDINSDKIDLELGLFSLKNRMFNEARVYFDKLFPSKNFIFNNDYNKELNSNIGSKSIITDKIINIFQGSFNLSISEIFKIHQYLMYILNDNNLIDIKTINNVNKLKNTKLLLKRHRKTKLSTLLRTNKSISSLDKNALFYKTSKSNDFNSNENNYNYLNTLTLESFYDVVLLDKYLVKEKQKIIKETLYYIKEYGSQEQLLTFYVNNCMFKDTVKFLLQNKIEYGIFKKEVVEKCFINNKKEMLFSLTLELKSYINTKVYKSNCLSLNTLNISYNENNNFNNTNKNINQVDKSINHSVYNNKLITNNDFYLHDKTYEEYIFNLLNEIVYYLISIGAEEDLVNWYALMEDYIQACIYSLVIAFKTKEQNIKIKYLSIALDNIINYLSTYDLKIKDDVIINNQNKKLYLYDINNIKYSQTNQTSASFDERNTYIDLKFDKKSMQKLHKIIELEIKVLQVNKDCKYSLLFNNASDKQKAVQDILTDNSCLAYEIIREFPNIEVFQIFMDCTKEFIINKQYDKFEILQDILHKWNKDGKLNTFKINFKDAWNGIIKYAITFSMENNIDYVSNYLFYLLPDDDYRIYVLISLNQLEEALYYIEKNEDKTMLNELRNKAILNENTELINKIDKINY